MPNVPSLQKLPEHTEPDGVSTIAALRVKPLKLIIQPRPKLRQYPRPLRKWSFTRRAFVGHPDSAVNWPVKGSGISDHWGVEVQGKCHSVMPSWYQVLATRGPPGVAVLEAPQRPNSRTWNWPKLGRGWRTWVTTPGDCLLESNCDTAETQRMGPRGGQTTMCRPGPGLSQRTKESTRSLTVSRTCLGERHTKAPGWAGGPLRRRGRRVKSEYNPFMPSYPHIENNTPTWNASSSSAGRTTSKASAAPSPSVSIPTAANTGNGWP